MYGSEQYKEDEEEVVMVTMYHSGETLSAIQPNRVDEVYYKQLNQ